MYRDELDLPDTFPDYSSVEYWDRRYNSERNTQYDWLLTYKDIHPLMVPRIHDNKDAEILVLGCGNSRMIGDIYEKGFKNLTGIDFSSVVIGQMIERYKQYEDCIEFHPMDVTNMQGFPENCFDVIIDKVVLDCLLCGEDSFAKATDMLSEVARILKPGAVFIMVSYGMPDTRIGYLKNKLLPWNIEYTKIPKTPLESFSSVEPSQYHYVYTCTKNFVQDQFNKKMNKA